MVFVSWTLAALANVRLKNSHGLSRCDTRKCLGRYHFLYLVVYSPREKYFVPQNIVYHSNVGIRWRWHRAKSELPQVEMLHDDDYEIIVNNAMWRKWNGRFQGKTTAYTQCVQLFQSEVAKLLGSFWLRFPRFYIATPSGKEVEEQPGGLFQERISIFSEW